MAILSTDTLKPEDISSNAKGNLGVTLGAIGTGLGLLNGAGGLLSLGGNGTNGSNGILGGVMPGNGNGGNYVPITKYYEDRIQDIRDMNGMFTDVKEQICNLRERASVSETANHYQNLMNQQAFGFIDSRFATERLVTDYEIGAATCDFIKAQKVITPAQMGTTYVNPTMALDQHEVRYIERGSGARCYDDCGYGGYRGF